MSLLWIPFTIMAAFMQSWRNALQKQLREHASTMGVTLARFIFALPLSVIYLIALYQYIPHASVPNFKGQFVVYIFIAAIAQIAATAFMVILFKERNYAVGVGLAKSEAIIAATLGALFFVAPLSIMAWSGVVVGGIAVLLMSLSPIKNTDEKNNSQDNNSKSGLKIANVSIKTVVIGLASGLCFALCTLFVRQAALALQQDMTFVTSVGGSQSFLLSAAWVLFFVLLTQTTLLTAWLIKKEPETIRTLCKHKKLTLSVSLFSFFGSIGWFTAMSLQTVAMVKTLGQIEVLFTLAISVWWFKEKLNRNDFLGFGLIVLGAVLVIFA